MCLGRQISFKRAKKSAYVFSSINDCDFNNYDVEKLLGIFIHEIFYGFLHRSQDSGIIKNGWGVRTGSLFSVFVEPDVRKYCLRYDSIILVTVFIKSKLLKPLALDFWRELDLQRTDAYKLFFVYKMRFPKILSLKGTGDNDTKSHLKYLHRWL